MHNYAEELSKHGRYFGYELIKQGGQATVLRAVDRITREWVALKLIPRSKVGGDGFAESEVLLHMRLRHPHIIALNEIFLTEHYLVLVLEYAAGGDVLDIIRPGGFSEEEARWLFVQVLFALEYCHRMGVANRDIKLDNLLLMDRSPPRPVIKLADFGLCAESRSVTGYRWTHGVVGTPSYLAPEVVENSTGLSYNARKVDVWSCGVLLYVMLTGRCPFQRDEDVHLDQKRRLGAMLERVMRVDYELPPTLSWSCRDIISKMLVKDPHLRPTVPQLLQHPWCSTDLQPATVLGFNDTFVARSLQRPPSEEMVEEVRSILREAASRPLTLWLEDGSPPTPPYGDVKEGTANQGGLQLGGSAGATAAPASC